MGGAAVAGGRALALLLPGGELEGVVLFYEAESGVRDAALGDGRKETTNIVPLVSVLRQ